MTEKYCTCCKKDLPIAMFTTHKRTKDGYSPYCKPCFNNKYMLRYNMNRTKKTPKKRVSKLGNRVYTDIVVEEGRKFNSPKDFIKFKRMRTIDNEKI